MDISIGTVGILVLVAATLGYVFGLLASRMISSSKKKDEGQKEPEAQEQKPLEIPTPVEEPSILRVRNAADGGVTLDLDGASVRSEDISTEQRQRLINIIVQIRPWVDSKSPAAPSAPVQSPIQRPMPQPMPQSASPVSMPPAIPAYPQQSYSQATSTNSGGTSASTPSSNTPPRINVVRGLRSLLENELSGKKEEQPPSIVALIDAVLQKKLAGTPLANRMIKLEDGPAGAVIVVIGKQRFEGIDAVPDPEIQAVIKSAVQEWQAQ